VSGRPAAGSAPLASYCSSGCSYQTRPTATSAPSRSETAPDWLPAKSGHRRERHSPDTPPPGAPGQRPVNEALADKCKTGSPWVGSVFIRIRTGRHQISSRGAHLSVGVASGTLALGAAPPQLLHVALAAERRLLPHVAAQAQVCHLLVLGAQRAPGLRRVPAQLLLELLDGDLGAELCVQIGRRVVMMGGRSVPVAPTCRRGSRVVTVDVAQRLPHGGQDSRNLWKMSSDIREPDHM